MFWKHSISPASILSLDNAAGLRKCVLLNSVSTETYRVSYLNDWIINLLKICTKFTHTFLIKLNRLTVVFSHISFSSYPRTFRFRCVTRRIHAALHLRIFIVFRERIIHQLNLCIYYVIFYWEQVNHI